LLPPEAGREPQPKANFLPLPTLPRMRNSRQRRSRAILEATLVNPLISSHHKILSLSLSLFLSSRSSQVKVAAKDSQKCITRALK